MLAAMADYPRIPYGLADFRRIRREGYPYVDKTRFLRLFEEVDFAVFIRPRRFGKSCWISLLEHYYDRRFSGEFDDLFAFARRHGIRLYGLIDEYDNFANTILSEQGEEAYRTFTHGGGFYRNFFATLKAGTEQGALRRLFVTGVSPVTLDDVTSGFNIDRNISLDPRFNELNPQKPARPRGKAHPWSTSTMPALYRMVFEARANRDSDVPRPPDQLLDMLVNKYQTCAEVNAAYAVIAPIIHFKMSALTPWMSALTPWMSAFVARLELSR